MQPKSRKALASFLTIGYITLDIFGSILINKVKSNIKTKLIKDYYPNNSTTLKKRYMKTYDNNEIKKREIANGTSLNASQDWEDGEYYIEAHNASHFHHDLSIILNNKVYRMARTPSKNNTKLGFLGLFPGPKEKASWILQPKHLINEVPNPGIIDDGYGAGTSKVIASGNCLVRISENNNIEVIFDQFDGVYAFVEKDKQCLVIRKYTQGPNLGGKHKMKTGKLSDLDSYNKSDKLIYVPKYDGSAVEIVVEKKDGHKYLRIYSWRNDKKMFKKYNVENQIDHTYKLKICEKEVNLDIPCFQGKGEVWIDEPIGFLQLTSVLNSGTYKAHKDPNNQKIKLVLHGIDWHENYKNIKDMNYLNKLEVIKEISNSDKRFICPSFVVTESDKKLLWTFLRSKGSYDGVIIWNKAQSKEPMKIKFKHEEEFYHQAVIVRLEPQSGQHSDKYCYPILQNEEGVEFKASGIGLTNEVKADMFNFPKKYIGRRTYYSAERHFLESGLPFQPILKEIL
jgi:hypothetical protein